MLIIFLCCDKMPRGKADLAPGLGVSVDRAPFLVCSEAVEWGGGRGVVEKSCSACSSLRGRVLGFLKPFKDCPRLPTSSKKSHLQDYTFLNILNVNPAKD